ncbi:unnamed protein product [Effrenium voratum]|uniref:Uncharacterized protein n=1 Tax=Effrenium voratum TaxID=2562239 RepID=A0AA36ITI7_9DINO|nr:unnamed protein product [Effrenium voratum]
MLRATLATEALSGRQPQFWLKSKAPAPKCHDKKLVNSESDKFLACPKECPVYADDRGDGVDCNFECVEATPKACTAVNKFEPIPDKEMGICRACIIYGCAECKTDGTDTCARCDSGYSVNAKGTCDNDNRYYWYALFVVLGGVTLFIVAWIVDICTRPIVNADGLKGALDYRSRSKVRMPKSSNDDEGRELYPLDTNLLKESVAGVGVTLHFNFQLFLIVWSLGIAVGWLLLSLSVDDALLILGTRRAKTARQNCILVAWGFETQQRLMWTKIDFVVVVYLLTVLGCVLFGIRQLRLFQKVDMQNSTHKDYAARIRNLPLLDGTTPVEDELKERIQEATGQKVVGVSVCWDFQEHEEELLDLLQSQLVEKELELHPMPQREEEPEEPQGFFARMERAALAADAQKVVATGEMTEEEKQKAVEEAAQAQPGEEIIEECKEVDVIGILKSIKTCPDAYAIFETETARDAAVEAAVSSGGVEFHGNTLKLNASRVEPQTVKWQNCANTDLVVKAKRVALGMCIMLAGLGVWVVAFYLPYAWFSLTFNYSYGQEPGFVAGMTFSMVVVAGNALMYLVCSEVADRTRFIYIDDREVCYMLLYCFACVFNVALDLITTYMVAYRINVGLHMKTYDGTLLQNLQSFSDRFESYAMQRTLANNLYAYAFPATFLIPFLIEPVATIYAPYKLMMMIVRTQPNMKGFMAENLLGSLVFDLSRYADLLLDAMIAVLIFFFPGGFNIQMFLGMALSHVYIYFFDHYRVLRSIQSCSYTDRMVDWWSQWLMCIPCGCMMACFVFKANCQPGYFCLEGDEMVTACAAAFFAHIALHTLLLRYVVPKFGLVGESDGADTNTYVACSKRLPCSWFTSNPVFCLRSQYVYKHSPPCTYYLPGKEHLIEQNEEIGLYFKDCPAKEEDYDAPHVDTEALKAQMKEMHGKVSGHMEEFKGKMTSQMEEMKGKVSGNLEQLKGKVSGHFDKLLKKDGPDGPDGDAQGSGGSATLATEALSGRQPQFWLKSKAPAPKCNDKKLVNSESDKFLACPKECPVYADDRGDGVDCNFECVEATPKACTAVNKFEPIPDKEMGICRACIIYGCAECNTDGTDTCARCDSGYSVNAKGTCDNNNRYYWYALFVVLGGVTLFIVAWIVDICTRPIVNADGLKGALDYRSRSKVRMPKSSNDDEGRELYPLDTNLLKESVAGVGVTLHFNFQLFLIVWSLGIAVGWLLLSLSVDDALLILGTRRAKTARQNCILVAWGFETQQRLMWTKIDFVVVVYLLTVLGCVLFGIRQLRLFQKVDMQNSTHKDYAARIRNLPLLDGTTPVEDELKERIQEATGQKVVGVSVCWDFQEHEEELLDLLQSQLVEKELELHPMPEREEEPEEPQGFFARMERAALAADAQKVVAKGEMTEEEKQKAVEEAAQAQPGEEIIEECKEVDVIGILKSIKTCPDAYAIFETETARDAAVEAAVSSGGVEFHGNTLKLNASRVEPQTVKWQNCANTDLVVKAKRVALGMCIMLAGLGVWVVAFYLPYAWFSLTFNYSYGQEPGFVAGMTFSMVVVAGNALMYLVCSEVADRTRFIYIDDREVCYMLLYCFACVFNVALDLITTYMVAYRINVGLHMKTYDGTLLQNLQSFSDRFESYAMQRTLANNLYAYAFPATFLIPFLIEPVATIYAPYKLMMMIVRTQPNMKGFMAENLLGSLVFDLSRYADLLLDAMIAVLIFFFPGGFNIQMFLGMALSHVYIYFFDHYRVLRSIQSCSYTDRMVDWWSQWLMCIPCGCMMACFVFKANCQPGYFCLEGDEMVTACAAAFFAHIALHTLLLLDPEYPSPLRYVVPKFGLAGESDGADTNTYVACSKRLPCSWFTSNPVFCLRSQYIYKHSPACTYYLPGKEHLIEQNVEIGLYFKDCPAKEEDYDAPHVDTEALKAQMKEMHGKVSGHMEEFKGKMTSQMEEMKGKVSGNLEQLKGKVSGHFDKLLKKDGPDGPDGDAQGSGGSASQS